MSRRTTLFFVIPAGYWRGYIRSENQIDSRYAMSGMTAEGGASNMLAHESTTGHHSRLYGLEERSLKVSSAIPDLSNSPFPNFTNR